MEGEQPDCPVLGGISCIQKGRSGRRAAWLPCLGWDQLYTEGEEWKESSLAALSWVGSAVQKKGGVEREQPGCPILGGISYIQKGRGGRRVAWLPCLGWDQLYRDRGWMEREQPDCPVLGRISCTQKGEGWKESSLTAPSWVGSAVHRRGGADA